MLVFVTGATGLIGNAVVRALVRAGHEVTGLTSRAANAKSIEAAGATPRPIAPRSRAPRW
jgi:uncharacterized protein YbjT (DUF2867 family)